MTYPIPVDDIIQYTLAQDYTLGDGTVTLTHGLANNLLAPSYVTMITNSSYGKGKDEIKAAYNLRSIDGDILTIDPIGADLSFSAGDYLECRVISNFTTDLQVDVTTLNDANSRNNNMVTPTWSSTIYLDGAISNLFNVPLQGDTELIINPALNVQQITVMISQDTSGGHAVTWGGAPISWSTGEPAIGSDPGTISIFVILCNSTARYGWAVYHQ